MCRLIETIRVVDGIASDLGYHQCRLNASYASLFGKRCEYILSELLNCPESLKKGVVKCRITYDEKELDMHFEPYHYKEARSFQLILCDDIDYDHKYSDRSQIERLYHQRGKQDDIIIVKSGKITDSSYANLVFKQGKDLFTPENALLMGTKRQKYVEAGLINTLDISVDLLSYFTHFKRINAMINLEEGEWLPISNIRPL